MRKFSITAISVLLIGFGCASAFAGETKVITSCEIQDPVDQKNYTLILAAEPEGGYLALFNEKGSFQQTTIRMARDKEFDPKWMHFSSLATASNQLKILVDISSTESNVQLKTPALNRGLPINLSCKIF